MHHPPHALSVPSSSVLELLLQSLQEKICETLFCLCSLRPGSPLFCSLCFRVLFSLCKVYRLCVLCFVFMEKAQGGLSIRLSSLLTVELGRWMKDTCLILDDLMNSPVLVECGVGLFLLLHRLR